MPGNRGLRLGRHEGRRFAQDGEVPQECVTPQAVAVDLSHRTTRDEASGLLGGIDHLA
jgi:hypothetical protein